MACQSCTTYGRAAAHLTQEPVMTSSEKLPYISSRRIGDATVTIISEGELPYAPNFNAPEADWRKAMPEADERGRFRFGLNVALIQTDDATILIDPGLDDP